MNTIIIEKKKDYNQRIKFGKWRGKTVKWVRRNQRGYWNWMLGEDIIVNKTLKKKAKDIVTVSDIAVKIKKELIKKYDCKSYYGLKMKIGSEGIYKEIRENMSEAVWKGYVKFRKLKLESSPSETETMSRENLRRVIKVG